MKRYIRPRAIPGKTIISIAIAAALMIGVSFAQWHFYKEEQKDIVQKANLEAPQEEEVYHEETHTYEEVFGDDFYDLSEELKKQLPSPDPVFNIPSEDEGVESIEGGEALTPIPKQHAVEKTSDEETYYPAPHWTGGHAKIAIIIDDMGVDKKRSQNIIEVSPPLTLAFLPYASGLKKQTEAALSNGHELMIHMPMEPMNPDLDTGAIAIKSDMSSDEIDKMLDMAFSSFDGYVGLNNHMGSRVTQSEKIMMQVMERLAERDLFFVDSKTINTSAPERAAAGYNISFADRDVFLDHVDSIEGVRASLEKLEKLALKNGQAIAIGHPKDSTIQGLREWLPTLADKNIKIVPASSLVQKPINLELATQSEKQ